MTQKAIIAFLVAFVIVMAAVAFVSLSQQPSASSLQSSSSTSTSNQSDTTLSSVGQTSTSSENASGLQLQINLNATTVDAGSALAAQVSLFNPHPQYTQLAANYSSNPNIVEWNSDDFHCGLGSVADIFGFAVLPGHETEDNFTLAGTNDILPVPLTLTPPVATTCPNPSSPEASIQYVVFAPQSDSATFSGNSSFKQETAAMQLSATTEACTSYPYEFNGYSVENGTTTSSSVTALGSTWGPGTSFDGYWSLPSSVTDVVIGGGTNATVTQELASLNETYFHHLPLGQYTMLAEDMWNDTAVAYFQVVSANPVPVGVSLSSFSFQGSFGYIVSPENIGQTPITSLHAALGTFNQPLGGPSSAFEVSQTFPLPPGFTVYHEVFELGPFGGRPGYYFPNLILTISGTLSTGTQFSYTLEVQVAPAG